jgi:diguanylate cyclase (GGDEF)-like protein
MPVAVDESANHPRAASLEQKVRSRIETLAFLPTTVSVAMKFIELGRNPDAEPAEYARIIESDSSLSSKLLALANSPWFGVRNKVTSVRLAVNLLGLQTVRTMAISYCAAGLHNELKLTPEESRMFWEASLCKAVAAKHYAEHVDPELADEAFLSGMFQDFALPVMYAADRESVLGLLQDTGRTAQVQVERERELFRLDHTEIGRLVAQKLQLPEYYVDAVAFHHDLDRLAEFMHKPVLNQAIHLASLFPHLLNAWNQADAERFCAYAEEHLGGTPDAAIRLLDGIQEEFNKLYRFFETADAPQGRLADLLIMAAREGADNTAHLVRAVHQLMQDAASMGMEMAYMAQAQSELEGKATRDSLTGALNRDGLAARAADLLGKASRYRAPLALIFIDLDKFKFINDTLGHDAGDHALTAVIGRINQAVQPGDAVARIGGDEFVVVLPDRSEEQALGVAESIRAGIAGGLPDPDRLPSRLSASLGLLLVCPSPATRSLDELVAAADNLMYQAKRAGGDRVAKGCA